MQQRKAYFNYIGEIFGLGAAFALGVIHGVWHFWSDFLANFGAMGGDY